MRFITLFLLVFIVFFSCRKITEPLESIKDPRTYTWTIDTLSYQGTLQTWMSLLWGSSPNDMYAIGHCSSLGGEMWHFDGSHWSPVKLHISQGGTIEGGFDLKCIFGLSANDIFVGGRDPGHPADETFLMHFDGREWQEIKSSYSGMIQSIWGSNPEDIWCAGWNNIYHYNDKNFKIVSFLRPTPKLIQFTSMCGFSKTNIYMIGNRSDSVMPIDTTAYDLYYYNGNVWSVIDSVVLTPENRYSHFSFYLASIGKNLYSAGDGAYKYYQNSWNSILDDNSIVRIGGTGDSNIIVASSYGQIFHYNGNNWQLIGPPDFGHFITDIWTDGHEVFLTGHDAHQTYILHGK